MGLVSTRIGPGSHLGGSGVGWTPAVLAPELWLDAALSGISGGQLVNLGTGGSALNATFGNSTGIDTFDPAYLPYADTNYLYLPGLAGNSVDCTAPATAVTFSATPVGGGAATTGAVTGGAAFSFATTGSWVQVLLLNGSGTTVAAFVVTSGAQTTYTDTFSVVWTINRSTSGRKSVAVTRNVLLFGSDDYLEVADSPQINFDATTSFTAFVGLRQWATPSASPNIMVKRPLAATGPRWGLVDNGAVIQSTGAINDGTNAGGAIGPAGTAGNLSLFGMRLDRTAQLSTAWVNNTAGAASSTTAVGTLVNTLPLRIGVLSDSATGNTDMEFVFAALWRRALTASEIAALVAYYGGV